MADHHHTHAEHAHQHGADCGHTAVKHNDHVDYLHDGHMHKAHGDHVDECKIAADSRNPAACTPGHACKSHPRDHKHAEGCGHEPVPHGDHICFLVNGHLHHPHSGHCDDHGPLPKA